MAALAVAAVVAGPVVAASSGADPGCAEPYAPVYGSTSGPYGPVRQVWPERPVQPPVTDGTDLDHHAAARVDGPDVDGDGRPDQVDIDLGTGEQTMVITSGSGTTRIGLRGHQLGSLTDRPLGDLDGDGRDEVLFLARPNSLGPDRVFILPGSTPPGSHQADDVSVEIPDYQVLGAGDQDGDGADDLVVSRPAAGSVYGESAVVSGADLLALGPGGRITSYDDAIRAVPGGAAAVYDLGGPAPAIVTIDGGPTEVILRLAQGDRTTTFHSTADQVPLRGLPFGTSMVRSSSGTLLMTGTGDRSGSVSAVWSVDDPCAALPAPTEGSTTTPETSGPPTTAPAASPAEPTSGSPTYTG